MMSESDWERTGCVPGMPDENCLEAISAVAAVLERGASHWDELLSVARNLLISSQSILRAARPLPCATMDSIVIGPLMT
jgi:hypothetical protein